LVTEGPTIPNPPKSVNPEEDECVKETYTDPNHVEYTIKVPPHPPVQKPKPLIQRNFVLHTRDSLPPHIPDPRVPLILGRPFLRTARAQNRGRPFLRTARALIEVHGEEMILRNGDESSTTYSANSLLEEFADELALIIYPPDYDDNRACDISSLISEK
nr:hypothetical protein [Tanacetum cinerariifolium]